MVLLCQTVRQLIHVCTSKLFGIFLRVVSMRSCYLLLYIGALDQACCHPSKNLVDGPQFLCLPNNGPYVWYIVCKIEVSDIFQK